MRPNVTDVVIVSDAGFVNGGSAKVALESAAGLADAGVRVTVFCGMGPVSPLLAERPNLRVVCTEQNDLLGEPNRAAAAVQGYWNFTSARAIGRLLDEMDPRSTVVHFHSWMKSLSPSVIAVALKRRFHVTVTLHEFFVACPNGTFYDHTQERICTRTPLSLACITARCDPRSYSHKVWRLGRQAVQKFVAHVPADVRHFVSVSPFSLEILRPHLPASASIRVIENPVDALAQPPADVAANDAFVYVGRLSREKGPLLFARAARLVGARAVFVGDGDLAPEIRSANPDAELVGWQSAPDVQRHIRAARALVFPSLWYETVGLVVLEAAAAGVPAIVPDTSAARDLVAHERTGLVFRGGDAASLEAAMRRLADAPTAGRLGAAAYEAFWSHPRPLAAHVTELRAYYEGMLSDAAA